MDVKNFKAQWIAALRSGEYKQTRQVYADDGQGFCCLGVGALLLGVPIERLDGADDALDRVCPKLCGMLPDGVAQKLAKMNDGTDGHPRSFAEIADYIEALTLVGEK